MVPFYLTSVLFKGLNWKLLHLRIDFSVSLSCLSVCFPLTYFVYMSIHVCTYMHMCTPIAHPFTLAHTPHMHTHICAYMHIHAHVHTYIHMHTHVHICHTCTHAHTHIYMYMCIHTYTCVHTPWYTCGDQRIHFENSFLFPLCGSWGSNSPFT